MGWYTIARSLIEPYLQFFRMIPPLAIIPLAIVTMGIDETPKIFVIFLAVVPGQRGCHLPGCDQR